MAKNRISGSGYGVVDGEKVAYTWEADKYSEDAEGMEQAVADDTIEIVMRHYNRSKATDAKNGSRPKAGVVPQTDDELLSELKALALKQKEESLSKKEKARKKKLAAEAYERELIG